MLDVLLQEHRDTEAAKTFFTTLLSTYEVPTTIHTDKLGSYGAAIWALPELHGAAHCEVISTARCNNVIEQRPSAYAGVIRRAALELSGTFRWGNSAPCAG